MRPAGRSCSDRAPRTRRQAPRALTAAARRAQAEQPLPERRQPRTQRPPSQAGHGQPPQPHVTAPPRESRDSRAPSGHVTAELSPGAAQGRRKRLRRCACALGLRASAPAGHVGKRQGNVAGRGHRGAGPPQMVPIGAVLGRVPPRRLPLVLGPDSMLNAGRQARATLGCCQLSWCLDLCLKSARRACE